VLILGACVTPASTPARLGLRLSPAALGETISVQQRLNVQGQGHDRELDTALEVDPGRVDLIGLAFGQKVFSLHYDGKALRSWRHPMWPAQLRDEDVLEDLQLTLWPVDAIRQALPAGWRIEESGLRRTILQNNLPMMVIDYSGSPPWSGKVEAANLQFHYRLMIQSVPNGS
jgi:Protein of unknown function (DUF3261)